MNYTAVNGNYQQFLSFPPNEMPYTAFVGNVYQTSASVACNGNDYTVRMDASSPSCDSAGSNPSVELMQMNGRKVLGPPEDWVGPPPSSVCELFVRRIPKDLNEHRLLAPFLRFGRIYEIRLPMDFNQAYRGYAYVKYTTEEDAACAMEVLNHYYISPGRKLEILHSYEKCRLFVSNIPKHLDEREIEEKLRAIFPSMERIYTRPVSTNPLDVRGQDIGVDDGANCNMDLGAGSSASSHGGAGGVFGNRGHVFAHFPSHLHALEAKKNVTPGLIRMWGKDLKVVWANTERDNNMPRTSKTLFVRNVDLTANNRDIMDLLVKHVSRTDVRKISKVRTTAFFDFTTRGAAEICLKNLQGVILRGRRLEVEWAKPSEQQSLHRMRDTDFDAVLRLKCIANGWHIPVVIFGCYYERERIQYGAIVLRDGGGTVRGTFCILNANELVDIHSRMCEVVCVLIETIGAFPDYNYVFMVDKDSANLLGMVSHKMHAVEFLAACGVPPDFYLDLNEIFDLSSAVHSFSYTTEDALLNTYKESFRTHNDCTYLKNWPMIHHRVFGTIMPKYRNKPSLKHDLNDTQIVLALCFKVTGTNAALPSRPFQPFAACAFDQGYEGLRYVSLKLLPTALTQSRTVASHILSHIQFGGSQYFHPAQRIMLPPMWIAGCSYSDSIKQPKGFMPFNHKKLKELPEQPQQPQPPQISQIQVTTSSYCQQPPRITTTPQTALYLPPQQNPSIMTPIPNTTMSTIPANSAGFLNFVSNMNHPNMTLPNFQGFTVVP